MPSPIKLEINQVQFEDFLDLTVTLSMETFSGTFSFRGSLTGGRPPLYEGGEVVKVFIYGEVVLDGYIDVVETSYSGSTHSFSIKGRDKTADLSDSSVSAINDFGKDLTLKSILESIIDHVGVEGVGVSDEVSGVDSKNPLIPFSSASDYLAPEFGQNAFEYMEKLARSKQVFLMSDGVGNILMVRGTGLNTKHSFIAKHKIANSNSANADNNILSSRIKFDVSKRFNQYITKSQSNHVALTDMGKAPTPDKAKSVNEVGLVFDTNIRKSRRFCFQAENPTEGDKNKSRAAWSANIRRARSRVYSFKVQDFRFPANQSGKLWRPNKLVIIDDDSTSMNEHMLITSVTFNYSVSGGSTTAITCVDKRSFSLAMGEPNKHKSEKGAVTDSYGEFVKGVEQGVKEGAGSETSQVPTEAELNA